MAVLGLWIGNTSLFTKPVEDGLQLIAHRGVHQTFHTRDLGRDTCTADRIDPVSHGFLENTLPSISRAFELGAAMVEIDIHKTSDDRLVVFHDWTVDCRTGGSGVTHRMSLAELKALDIGYGYTVDGDNFPFRGKFVGAMPTLEEVLEAFPDGRFLLDFKDDKENVGDLLANLLIEKPDWEQRISGAYGGEKAVAALLDKFPGIKGFSRPRVKACALDYLKIGWTGAVPDSCHNMYLVIPKNAAPFFWGWPARFEERMAAVDTKVIIFGPLESRQSPTEGLNDPTEAAALRDQGFSGYIWTDKIQEMVGD